MRWPGWIAIGALSAVAWAAPPNPPAVPAPLPLPAAQLPTPPEPTPMVIKDEPLGYAEAPLVALANNPKVTAALAKARASLYDVGRFEAAGRPRGSLVLLGPPLPVSTENAQVRGDYVLSPARLELRKLVYDGGKLKAIVEQAKSAARQAAWTAQVDWQQLHYDVREAYLTVLARQGDVALAKDQVGLAKEQLRQAEARYRLGQAPKGDVLSAGLPVSEAELLVQKNQGLAETAQRTLNQLLGLDIRTSLRLERPKIPDNLPDLDQCLAEAMAHRADLLALEHTLLSYQHSVRAAELDNHPYVDLLAGLALQSSPESYIQGFTYRGGFEVTWPFADGGKSVHQTKAARANVEYALAKVAEQKQMVEMEVRDSYAQIGIAVAAHTTEQKRVENARDALRIAQAQYKAGMVTIYPVRQAQGDLYTAQQSQNQAYFDYFLALAKLDLACGRTGDTVLNTRMPKDY